MEILAGRAPTGAVRPFHARPNKRRTVAAKPDGAGSHGRIPPCQPRLRRFQPSQRQPLRKRTDLSSIGGRSRRLNAVVGHASRRQPAFSNWRDPSSRGDRRSSPVTRIAVTAGNAVARRRRAPSWFPGCLCARKSIPSIWWRWFCGFGAGKTPFSAPPAPLGPPVGHHDYRGS